MIPLVRIISDLFTGSTNVHPPESDENSLINWVTLNLIASCFASFLLIMFYFWAGMRHMGDFLPFLTILSAIGFWQGYRLLARKPLLTTWYALTGMILASLSIAMGILLTISTVYV